MKKTTKQRRQETPAAVAAHLSWISLAGNAVLAAVKLAAGLAGHSAAMIADAAHSASDLVSTLIAWLGVRAAQKPADKEHPYGHERLECAAALLLGAVLAAAGIGIGWEPMRSLLEGGSGSARPETAALAAAAASVFIKEWMFRYTRKWALSIGSTAFVADAWHHRSDAYSSIGALVGIAGSMLGWPAMDSIAGLIICGFVLKAAWDIARDAFRRLLDTSGGAGLEQELSRYIAAVPGVESVDLLRTRLFGSRIFVDLEIGVSAERTFQDAHAVAEQVHLGLEEAFPVIKHVMVHPNPVAPSSRLSAGAAGTLNSGLC